MKKLLSLVLIISLLGAIFSGCVAKRPFAGGVGSDGNPVDTSKFIGEEKAKEIALEKSGISSDGVRFDRVELDRDNGVWQYEVEFKQGTIEYDAHIKADDGAILLFDTEYDD